MKFLGQDFILGIHTKFQCDMMKQFGSCLICVCRLKFLKQFWLKKGIPRKEAAERVLPMNTGCFLVRGSSRGGYALML